MSFPGTRFFQKNWEIYRPEYSGTSSSWSQLSTGIWDWLLPVLFQVGNYFSDFSRIFPSNGTIKKWSCPGPANLSIALQSHLVLSRLKQLRNADLYVLTTAPCHTLLAKSSYMKLSPKRLQQENN